MALSAQESLPEIGSEDHSPEVLSNDDPTLPPPVPLLAFPIVGIGASAGGLTAAGKLFDAMPADSGMAFVLILHLDPTHMSMLAQVLSKRTKMVVHEAQDLMRVEPNAVYVIPPGQCLTLEGGMLHLSAPVAPRAMRMPIDAFFQSLAAAQQERAIGVILSGMGTDGAEPGTKAIKAGGGMVIVQDPTDAQHDGMPRSAIAVGMVDFVLPVNQIHEVLIKYAQQPYVRGDANTTTTTTGREPDDIDTALALLLTRTDLDFRCYKQGTLLRRIQRRMGLHQIQTMADYLRLMRAQPDEIRRLSKDLLIGVTSFFREPQAFAMLADLVVPQLLEIGSADHPLRMWVPACATGEEVYSIAMLLLERRARSDHKFELKIFATDADLEALAVARVGVYPDSITAEVSAERLERFFTKEDENHYRVSKELREAVVFAPQNLLRHPPFSRMDLVVCRNLLIYLKAEAQNNLIALLHFALNPGGFLFLGSAEHIGEQDAMFEPVSKRWRIYRRIGASRPARLTLRANTWMKQGPEAPSSRPVPANRPTGLDHLAQELLLREFAPAVALINRDGQVLYLAGPIAHFLEAPGGEPVQELVAMARLSLRPRLQAAIHKAIHENSSVVVTHAPITSGGNESPTTISVRPAKLPRSGENLWLVTFEDTRPAPPSGPNDPAVRAGTDEALVSQLEFELKTTRADLQVTIAELETSNEELTASNEEAMSGNEELQSTNEELETSAEELQSLNEELGTVNNQLLAKVGELEAATNDLSNLITSTDQPTIFLDRRMCIRWFAPAMTRLLHLIASDRGRPLNDFAQGLVGANLVKDVQTVLDGGVPVETEVRTDAEQWYIRRVLPYRVNEMVIDGVVVTFIDITRRKRDEVELRRLAAVVRDSNDAVVMYNLSGAIQTWNHGAEHLFGYTEAEALTMNARDLLPPDRLEESAANHRRLVAGEAVEPYESQGITKDRRLVDVWVTTTRVTDESGSLVAVATTKRDITERKLAEQQRELYALNLRAMNHEVLLAEARERRRVAVDLHDGLGQILALAQIKLGATRSATSAVSLRKSCKELSQLVDQAQSTVSRLTFELSPPVLHELGFVPAAHWMANDIERRYGITVTVEDDNQPKAIEEQIGLVLFRSLRELLINVAKHAQTSKVRVVLSRHDDDVQVAVVDQGRGFDIDGVVDHESGKPQKSGFGLFSIRERIQHLGGTMVLESVPGKGTTVTLKVPMTPAGSGPKET